MPFSIRRGLIASVFLFVPIVFGADKKQVPPTNVKVHPILEADGRLEMKFGGFFGQRLRANLEHWELRVPGADPALVQMFYDRDRTPGRDLLTWSGEFIGKYLCASILSYRILRDPRQKA